MSRPRALDMLPAKIASRIVVGDGCWSWAGWHNQTRSGRYGYVRWDGRDRPVHRVVYELVNGVTVPKGHDVDHLCRNASCVRPDHLEAVTHRVNLKRGRAGSKTACSYGHDWTDPKNVYVRHTGVRWCAACARERWS